MTNTSIKIGYGDDAGYSAAPGLDKEMGDAVKPMSSKAAHRPGTIETSGACKRDSYRVRLSATSPRHICRR